METDLYNPSAQTLDLPALLLDCTYWQLTSFILISKAAGVFCVIDILEINGHCYSFLPVPGIYSSERLAGVFSYESSEIDWCEENYKHSEHVVEYFNTVSFFF